MSDDLTSFLLWYRDQNGLVVSKRSKRYWSLNINKFEYSIEGYKILSGRYLLLDDLDRGVSKGNVIVILNNKEEYIFNDCSGLKCIRKVLI